MDYLEEDVGALLLVPIRFSSVGKHPIKSKTFWWLDLSEEQAFVCPRM